MARYYDLDKLSGLVEAKADTLMGTGKTAFLYVAKWLDLLPAADVAPRAEAEWVVRGKHFPHCSACGKLADTKEDSGGWRHYHKSNFCPNCGAKMKNAEDKK